MIENYLFVAAFVVQILAISVFVPARMIRQVRVDMAKIPAERLAGVFPGVDVNRAYDRFIARYRAANAVVTVAGLLLLVWFLRSAQQPDWDEGRIVGVLTIYFLLQNIPLMVFAGLVVRFNKAHASSATESKRKAVLQRRGLLDYVSPWMLALAVLSYCQFAAVTLYTTRHPFPGFGGFFANMGILTLMFVFLGSIVYWMMYGRKKAPLETRESRLQVTRMVVNAYVWMCILIPASMSLTLARRMLELDSWVPLSTSLFFLILSLISFPARRAPLASQQLLVQ